MPYIEWSDKYRLGIEEMDKQHKRWIEILNAFYDSVSEKDKHANLIRLLGDAVQYAHVHFKSEEAFMKRIGYPGIDGQHAMHEGIAKHLEEYKAKAESGKMVLSLTITNEMKVWLNDHILDEDKKYADYYRRMKPA